MVDESVWSTAVPVQVERERERETERKGGERQKKTERTGGFSYAGVFIAGKKSLTHTYTHCRLS